LIDEQSVSRTTIAILDAMMPGMSGLEVLRSINTWEVDGEVPVVMFSSSDEHRDEAMRLGVASARRNRNS